MKSSHTKLELKIVHHHLTFIKGQRVMQRLGDIYICGDVQYGDKKWSDRTMNDFSDIKI